MYDLLDALKEWADEQAASYRRQGFECQQRGANIMAATMIGREWAFISMATRIAEIQNGQTEAMQKMIPGVLDPRD